MKKIISKRAIAVCLFLFIMTVCVTALSAPAYSADKAIAKLTSFSGTVLIKSKGAWGVQPEKDLPLYSDDKIVTRMGIATITFDDGAVIEIKANSNLLIRDTGETGIGKEVGAVKRQLRLLIGKMLFRSGRGTSVNTSLETTTMVCGLRGTAGTLSIDAAGVTYIQFTEGGGDTIGNFISGVAPDVPAELADLNPAQRAAFIAAAAAVQAKNAADRLAKGGISDAEAALAAAKAAEAAAEEAKAAAEAMLNNPDPELQDDAAAAFAAAEAALGATRRAIEKAVEAGATGEALGIDITGLGTIGFDTQQLTDFMDGGDDATVFGSSYGVFGDNLKQAVDSFTAQGNESEILPPQSGDVVPPVIEMTDYPAAFENSSSPVFQFSADEYVRYYYSLDGGTLISAGTSEGGDIAGFELTGLPEGSHTLDLIVRDVYGNETTETFSWITDTIAPVVTLSVEPGTTTRLIALLSNTEPGDVDYLFVNASTGETMSPETLADGAYSVNVIATDQAGNSSTTPFTFILDNQALTGNITGSGSIISGTLTGAASIIDGQNWGGWNTSMTGSWSGAHTGTLSLASGGYRQNADGDEDGVWMSLTSGSINTDTGSATGSTDFIMMNDTILSRGTGTFTGEFGTGASGTWTGMETGTGLITEPLAFSGNLSSTPGYFWRYGAQQPYYQNVGYVGLVYRGNYYDYVMMGPYGGTLDNGPYLSLFYIYDYDETTSDYDYPGLGGAIWNNGEFNGMIAATYDTTDLSANSAGIFYQKLSGNYYETPISTWTGMWISQGELTPVVMTDIVDGTNYVNDASNSQRDLNFSLTGDIALNSDINTAIGGNGLATNTKVMNTNGTSDTADDTLNMLFGTWSAGLIGTYTSSPADGWSVRLTDGADQVYSPDTLAWIMIGPGSGDSLWNTTTNEMLAYAAGAWVNLDDMITGVSGGRLVGTFDASNWQAIAVGTLIDTHTFLAMADPGNAEGLAKLAQLDIPCVEVGSATLDGGYTPAAANIELWHVTMNDVKFFAYSTGEAPKIWATGDVQGTVYNSANPVNTTANLTGTNFSASFTMNNYNVGTGWDASVNGSGIINNPIQITGGAAGTNASSSSFSGTAAGIAEVIQ